MGGTNLPWALINKQCIDINILNRKFEMYRHEALCNEMKIILMAKKRYFHPLLTDLSNIAI